MSVLLIKMLKLGKLYMITFNSVSGNMKKIIFICFVLFTQSCTWEEQYNSYSYLENKLKKFTYESGIDGVIWDKYSYSFEYDENQKITKCEYKRGDLTSTYTIVYSTETINYNKIASIQVSTKTSNEEYGIDYSFEYNNSNGVRINNSLDKESWLELDRFTDDRVLSKRWIKNENIIKEHVNVWRLDSLIEQNHYSSITESTTIKNELNKMSVFESVSKTAFSNNHSKLSTSSNQLNYLYSLLFTSVNQTNPIYSSFQQLSMLFPDPMFSSKFIPIRITQQKGEEINFSTVFTLIINSNGKPETIFSETENFERYTFEYFE